jgi:uncharacterized damage-inducible protein DinB
MHAFWSGLTDDGLTRNVEFAMGGSQKHSVPLGDLMQHAALHAVHHRGRVALLLRTLGYVPGNFDMLLYVSDQRNVPD